MIASNLGNYSLCAAVLVAVVGVLAAVYAGRFGSEGALRVARRSIGGVAVLFTICAAALTVCLVGGDFQVDYVQRYTERLLPLGYKLAAFWAGQEGSLLLWGWMLAAMCTIVAAGQGGERDAAEKSITERAVVLAALAATCGFFAALMLIAANPFAPAAHAAADGRGLNPMLQNPGMIAHPPVLFLGYAASTVPFAMMLGALVAGRTDPAWISKIRRWTLATWLFLSIGILLGAQWAYVELGWGGYWAWDPVENASLLPWLTVTALLHSIMPQQQRGMFKVWNVVLVSLTFVLCIFGTYLTRSGIVQSVHSFGASSVGTFFLVFLAVAVLVSVYVLVWRYGMLKYQPALSSMISREGGFMAANWLLLAMMAITAAGTVFPVMAGIFGKESVSPSQGFYNRAVLPLAMALIAIMAVAPMLGSGKPDLRKLGRRFAIPAGVAGLVVGLLLAVWRIGNPWALVAGAAAAVAVTCVVLDFVKIVAQRRVRLNEGWATAAVRVLDSNHRRYGGQVVHLGIMMATIGIVGSSLYNQKETLQLRAGQSAQAAGLTVKLEKIEEITGATLNYDAVEAVVTLTDASGVARPVRPQRRFYKKWEEQASSEVSIQGDLAKDLYVTLAGWEDGGRLVAIQVIVNPLVNWIWIGGIAMAVGGIVCMLPRLEPRAWREGVAEEAEKRVRPAGRPMREAAGVAVVVLAAGLVYAGGAAAGEPATSPSLSDVVLSATAQQGETTKPAELPAGHPPIGGLPAGHPDISGMNAAAPAAVRPSTQPSTIGWLRVQAVQGTKGGAKIGPEPVVVEMYNNGKVLDKVETKLDAGGALLLPNLPTVTPFQPVIRVEYQGLEYQVVGEVMDVEHPRQLVDVRVFEKTEAEPRWQIGMRHLILSPTAMGLQVVEMLSVENPSDRTWTGKLAADGKKGTLALALPAGASGVRPGEGFHEDEIRVIDGRLVSSIPVMPGTIQLQLSYVIPALDGTARVTAVAPAKTDRLRVFVPDDGTKVEASGLEAAGVVNMGRGNTRFYKAGPVEAGQAVAVTVSGITKDKFAAELAEAAAGDAAKPSSGAPKVVGILAAVGLVVGVAAIFLRPVKAAKKGR